jgi:phosphoglycerate dehydrogenase-like enzyme
MSILVLATSPFVQAQLDALRALAPAETIHTDVDAAADAEALLAFKLAPGVAARLPRLRFIAGAGAGVDELLASDVPNGVPVTRMQDPLQATRMAQYVTLAVLRWQRELPRYEAQQRGRVWERHLPQAETGWTIGLMGCGTLGRVVARALQQLGYPVRTWTRTSHVEPDIECFTGPDRLQPFLAGTRVLVCLLPLTPLTRGLVNAALLARLPRGAYVVNAARGALVDDAGLLAALDSGRLAGAALDVHAQEPLPPDSPFWSDGRIVVTPHIAASPRPEIAARQFLDNLERARRGQPLLNLVDRARGY